MTAPCWRSRRARRKKVSARPPASQCVLTQITHCHLRGGAQAVGGEEDAEVQGSLSWIWRGQSGSLEKELPGPVGDHLHPLPGSFQAPWVPGFGGPAGQRAPLLNASMCCMHRCSPDSQKDAREVPDPALSSSANRWGVQGHTCSHQRERRSSPTVTLEGPGPRTGNKTRGEGST